MKKLFLTLFILLAVSLLGSAAKAGTISGTVKYRNVWDANTIEDGRFAGFSDTDKILGSVSICYRNNSTNSEKCGYTNAAGFYSIANVPAATYKIRIYYLTSDGKFKMVADDGTNDGGVYLFSQDQNLYVYTGGNFTRSFTVGQSTGWNTVGNRNLSSNYAAIRAWFDILSIDLGSYSPYTSMPQLIFIDKNANASSGGQVIWADLDGTTGPFTVWHEAGHSLQIILQKQLWVANDTWQTPPVPTQFSPAGSCMWVDNGAPLQAASPSGVNLIEGWADFIVRVISNDQHSTRFHRGMSCGCLSTGDAIDIDPLDYVAHPACGMGSMFRSREHAASTLIDLWDDVDNADPQFCYPDVVSMSLLAIVDMMRNMKLSSLGSSWGNSSRSEDSLSVLDLLFKAQGLTGVGMYELWGNNCYQQGKATNPLFPETFDF